MSKGDFFAIGRSQWARACKLGMNPAVSLAVMARGTGRDNSTSAWSAEAVSKYTGMGWRRAKVAVSELLKAKVAVCDKPGKRPRYKLDIPDDLQDMIWLPNTLVTGAGDEVPPLARLRQSQSVEALQTFVELYFDHDLSGDGGLPRSLVYAPFDPRTHICDVAQFEVYGFTRQTSRFCNTVGPLQRFNGRKENTAWEFLRLMERMGLMESVDYLVESDDPSAELVHPLTGDAQALGVRDAAQALATELPGGFKYETEAYDYVLPILPHMGKATVVGVSRLVYRPHTTKTSSWYAAHVDTCQRFTELYAAMARGEFRKVA